MHDTGMGFLFLIVTAMQLLAKGEYKIQSHRDRKLIIGLHGRFT